MDDLELDLEKIIELRDLLNEMLPENVNEMHLAKIIGTVLSIYQVNDVRDVTFICHMAASYYGSFLADTDNEDVELH